MLIRNAISAINPNATVLMTEFGMVDWDQYTMALASPLGFSSGLQQTDFVEAAHSSEHDEERAQAEREVHVHEGEDALGYESFGLVFDDVSFEQGALESVFGELNNSKMGEVVRAKGIFRVDQKCILMELASGEFSSQPVRMTDESRVSVIGRNLDRKRVGAAFERCVSRGE